MIMHLALFTWRESTSREDIARVETELSRMPSVVPALREYHFGPNLGLRPGTADFAVCAVISQAELSSYLDHPEHQRVVREVISPLLASRTAVQIEHLDRVPPR
ncbi:MAG TPA: Dabb family protein [Kineosporiaceae bacterium]|nr:Dabb family protein [Kineosporiaceae bacterium]